MTISLRMALRYLWGRKLRTTLTTLAIVFGVAVIFGGNLALPSIIDAFKQMTLSATDSVDLTITNRGGTSFAPDEPLRLVAGVDGVQAAAGVLQRQISLLPDTLRGTILVELVGVDPATIGAVRQFRLVDGRLLQPGDQHMIVLPANAAASGPPVAAGSTLALPTAEGLQNFTVAGVLEDAAVGTPRLYVTLADAQAISEQPGLINAIELVIKPGADNEAVLASVTGALGTDFVVGAEGNAADALASVNLAYAMFNLLGLLALFIGGFLIFNTFRTVVLERRHDLGMLRAIGAERGQVTRMLLIEGLVQGVIGTTVGVLAGYGFAALMTVLINGLVTEMMPGLHVTLAFNSTALILAVVFGLLTTLVAGYIPARAAGKVSPLEALRPTPDAGMRRAMRWSLWGGIILIVVAAILLVSSERTSAGGAILCLVGLAVIAPSLVIPAARLFSPMITLWFATEGQIAEGNMTRLPGRAAITASTLMIGLAVLVVTTAMASSQTAFLTNIFDRAFSSDIILIPQTIGSYGTNVGADEQLAERLRAIPEVAVVGTLRSADATTGETGMAVLGIDPAGYSQVSPLTLAEGTPESAYADLSSGRTLIANQILATSLGLKVGDNIELQTANGPQSYRVVAIGTDALNYKISTIFISQANIASDFNKNDDVMLMLKLKPGADVAAARDAVAAVAADYQQFSVRVTAEYRENVLGGLLSALRGVYLLIGLIILVPAGLGLLNTLTINVLERTREIGMMRAVGGSRSQIRRMVAAEAVLLGLFGAAIGVLAGVAMSYGFVHAVAGSTGWPLPYAFPLLGIISAAVLAVLLALFASILPARNAAQLDIIRALQFE